MNILRSNSSAVHNRVVYPDPTFDLADVGFLRVRSSFRWCLRFFTHPVIFAALWKFATYPVTELLFSREDDESVSDKIKDLFNNALRLRMFLLDMGLDYAVFGNAFCTIRYPFKKYLQCAECKNWALANEYKYKYSDGRYRIEKCPNCVGYGYFAKAQDRYTHTSEGISLVRWSPEDVDVIYTPLMPPGRERIFLMAVPQATVNAVKRGKKYVIENLEEPVLKAIKDGKRLEVRATDVYHMKRPSPSKGRYEDGLGIPLILPVLRNALLLNLLFKAEESLAVDQIIPFRGLYPNMPPGSPALGASPGANQSSAKITEELEKWYRDRNYVGAFPFPVSEFNLGGRARSLMMSPEIQAHSEIILAGMGFPREWAFGGLTFAGSSVSHRMLENYILGYRNELYGCANFIAEKVCASVKLPRLTVRMRDFRMADDLNRAQFDLNLQREGNISRQTLLEAREHDMDEENRRIENEIRESNRLYRIQRSLQAQADGEAQKVAARYQIEVQKMQTLAQAELQQMMPQPPPQPGAPGAPPPQEGPPPPEGQAPPPPEGALPPEGQTAPPQGQAAPPQGQMPPEQAPQGQVPPGQGQAAGPPPQEADVMPPSAAGPPEEANLVNMVANFERMDPLTRRMRMRELQLTNRALASQVMAGLAANDQNRWGGLGLIPGPETPTLQ